MRRDGEDSLKFVSPAWMHCLANKEGDWGRSSVPTPRAGPRNAQAFFWALVFASGLGCFQDCDANATAQNAVPDPPGRSRLPRPWLLSILCIFYSTYENCCCAGVVIHASSCLIHSLDTFKTLANAYLLSQANYF